MARRLTHYTTDHDTIREWAEERGGSPSAVKGTPRGGEDPGIIRIDFPGYSGAGKLRKISWPEFFKKFDQSNLVFIYQDKTARGQRSNFNKFISAENADLADVERDRGSEEEQDWETGRGRGGGGARPSARGRTSQRRAAGGAGGTRSARGGRAGGRSSARRGTRAGAADRGDRGAETQGSRRGSTRAGGSRASRTGGRSTTARSASRR